MNTYGCKIIIIICCLMQQDLYSMRFLGNATETLDSLPSESNNVFIGSYQSQYIGSKLLAELKINPSQLPEVLKKLTTGKTVQASIMIWGGLQLDEITRISLEAEDIPVPPAYPNYYNAIFHKVVGSWAGPKDNKKFDGLIVGSLGTGDKGTFHTRDTSGENPIKQSTTIFTAGVFAADGITPAKGSSIAFEQLKELEIHIHVPYAFSPDNGRFSPRSDRYLATFWLVGMYGSHMVATYNLMSLRAETQSALLELTLIKNNSTQEFSKNLRNLAATGFADRTQQAQDIRALENFADFLQTQIPLGEQKAKAEVQSKPAQQSVAQDLALLEANLRSLASAIK
jgi:hypothetical protein